MRVTDAPKSAGCEAGGRSRMHKGNSRTHLYNTDAKEHSWSIYGVDLDEWLKIFSIKISAHKQNCVVKVFDTSCARTYHRV